MMLGVCLTDNVRKFRLNLSMSKRYRCATIYRLTMIRGPPPQKYIRIGQF
jgi:hypothetical protein